nr:response regulator transcription factor [Chromobacterium sp. ASV5]
MKNSVSIVDDHEVVRAGLRYILEGTGRFEVWGEFSSAVGLLDSLKARCPDILIMDYMLEQGAHDGIRLIKRVKEEHPQLYLIVVSSIKIPGATEEIIRAGADNFFPKGGDLNKLIEMMAERKARVGSKATEAEESIFETLTSREKEVVRCCLDGMTVTQIALKFSRSVKTISLQKNAAYRKLGISNDRELFILFGIL